MADIRNIISDIIEAANNAYPLNGGYRANFYKAIAEELIEIADGLEESK